LRASSPPSPACTTSASSRICAPASSSRKYTSSVSQSHFVAPGDIYTIYNVNPLLTTYTGAGVGTGANCHSLPAGTLCGDIAVTGQVDLIANDADVVAFRSASGLSTTNLPTTVHEGGDPGFAICNSCTTGPNESDLAESSIDVEWSGAMATGASILFVNGPDVFFYSMTQAIDQDLAPIITTSYGACEAGWGTTEMISLNTLFKQANAQGQTVLAAAADEGATDCDSGPTASEGLNADFPGSSPYVTSLGGTQFNDGTALGATQYWSASNGTTGGSAVSYIPESVWNDEVLFDSYGGGGGGASAYFTKPAWQVGITTSDGSRDEPDLSLDASDGHEPFLYCVNVPTAVSCGSGYRVSTSNTGLEVAGGTSFDSQIFGGMLALVEQKTGSRIGNANPTIYALGSSVTYYTPGATTASLSTAVFNDVTTGNNAMPCATGTPSCGNGGTEGYSAQPGYDLASGWGSPNVFNMANAWNLVTPRSSGTLGANLSVTNLIINPNCPTSGAACLTTVSSGATVTLVATVVGGGTTPTGTVQFLANNTALASAVSVTALNATTATATYSWVTTCNNLGQNVVSASYSGDTNYQGSIGPVLTAAGASQTSAGSFIVSPLEVQVASTSCPDFSVTPGSTSVTVAAGGTIPAVTITAAALNGFIGTVVFSGTATSSTGYPLTITFSPASITLPTTTSTSLQISGITADLRLPNAPGQTDPGTMLAQQHQGSRLPWYATGSGVTIASLLLLILPRKRRFGGLLLAALSIALIGGATGCGSSQAGPPTTIVSTNPYVGTYFVTVIGTYTNTNTTTGQVTTHSQLVTYTIN
jgi:subtilase family serine protease